MQIVVGLIVLLVKKGVLTENEALELIDPVQKSD
jgi:hypothetical protein